SLNVVPTQPQRRLTRGAYTRFASQMRDSRRAWSRARRGRAAIRLGLDPVNARSVGYCVARVHDQARVVPQRPVDEVAVGGEQHDREAVAAEARAGEVGEEAERLR